MQVRGQVGRSNEGAEELTRGKEGKRRDGGRLAVKRRAQKRIRYGRKTNREVDGQTVTVTDLPTGRQAHR